MIAETGRAVVDGAAFDAWAAEERSRRWRGWLEGPARFGTLAVVVLLFTVAWVTPDHPYRTYLPDGTRRTVGGHASPPVAMFANEVNEVSRGRSGLRSIIVPETRWAMASRLFGLVALLALGHALAPRVRARSVLAALSGGLAASVAVWLRLMPSSGDGGGASWLLALLIAPLPLVAASIAATAVWERREWVRPAAWIAAVTITAGPIPFAILVANVGPTESPQPAFGLGAAAAILAATFLVEAELAAAEERVAESVGSARSRS